MAPRRRRGAPHPVRAGKSPASGSSTADPKVRAIRAAEELLTFAGVFLSDPATDESITKGIRNA
jgi:hypothetical protein